MSVSFCADWLAPASRMTLVTSTMFAGRVPGIPLQAQPAGADTVMGVTPPNASAFTVVGRTL